MFRVEGFRVWVLGLGVWGLGFVSSGKVLDESGF